MPSPHRKHFYLSGVAKIGPWPLGIIIWTLIVLVGVGVASAENWDWLSNDESRSAVIRNIILAVIGVVALPLALWRSLVAANQLVTAQRSLLGERYQKGAEMLNGSSLSARLGGIYTLRQLAQRNPSTYHVQIMRLLCAYFREQVSVTRPFDNQKSIESERIREEQLLPHQKTEKEVFDEHTNRLVLKLKEDEQAIFDIFKSRSAAQLEAEEKEGYLLDLTGLNLSNTDLHQGQFINVDLSDTDMSESSLWGSTFRQSNFRNTKMNGAELGGSIFVAPKNQIDNVVSVPLMFIDANLFEVTLDNANLTSAQLTNARLENASLQNARLAGANVKDANFEGANISGTRFAEKPDHLGKCTIGLTQSQLDQTIPTISKVPFLDGVMDAQTGEPLIWRGKSRGDA